MDMENEVRWRLRDEDHIVGYERHVGRRIFSSADGLWWRGDRLNYTSKDRCLMHKDINNQWLFEGDVVTWHAQSGQWQLLFEENQWVICQDNFSIPAPMQDRLLKRVGFAFLR